MSGTTRAAQNSVSIYERVDSCEGAEPGKMSPLAIAVAASSASRLSSAVPGRGCRGLLLHLGLGWYSVVISPFQLEDLLS